MNVFALVECFLGNEDIVISGDGNYGASLGVFLLK